MDGVTTNEMLNFIREFILSMHDYDPMEGEFYMNGSNGCFNTKYHGNMFQSYINPPVGNGMNVSYPELVIAYDVVGSGDIFVYTDNGETYKLIDCLGASISSVYKHLLEAKEVRDQYELTKKEEKD